MYMYILCFVKKDHTHPGLPGLMQATPTLVSLASCRPYPPWSPWPHAGHTHPGLPGLMQATPTLVSLAGLMQTTPTLVSLASGSRQSMMQEKMASNLDTCTSSAAAQPDSPSSPRATQPCPPVGVASPLWAQRVMVEREVARNREEQTSSSWYWPVDTHTHTHTPCQHKKCTYGIVHCIRT